MTHRNSYATIPGTQYPRMATCGAPISDAEGNTSPCATETLKSNPTERCGTCKSRLKDASRLRGNAADRKRARLAKAAKLVSCAFNKPFHAENVSAQVPPKSKSRVVVGSCAAESARDLGGFKSEEK